MSDRRAELLTAIEAAGGKAGIFKDDGWDPEWPDDIRHLGDLYSVWGADLSLSDCRALRDMCDDGTLVLVNYPYIPWEANHFYEEISFEVALPGCEYYVLNERSVARPPESDLTPPRAR